MARETVVTYTDDLDGSSGGDANVGEVEFAWGGASYTIDLSQANREKYNELFGVLIEAGQRVGRFKPEAKAGAGAVKRAPVDREQTRAIRDWANKKGFNVSDRGRIPANVLEAYHEEHDRR